MVIMSRGSRVALKRSHVLPVRLLGLIGLLLVPFGGCVDTNPAPAEDASIAPEQTETPPPSTSASGTVGDASVQSPMPSVEVHVLAVSNGFYPANPSYELNVSSIPANATIVLTYRDQDLNPLGKHDWTLEGVEGAQTPLVDTGQEATIEFLAPAEPGEYVYYCSVPQHRGFGMEGILAVV